MKQYLILSAFLMLLLVGSSACKKTSTGPDGNNQPFMTATVNGLGWSGIIPGYGYHGSYLDFNGGDDHSVITIYYTQTDTGTYPINGNTGAPCFATYDTLQDTYISYTNSGTIHFSRLDTNHVTGTFNFIATDPANDTVRITNGTFNMAL